MNIIQRDFYKGFLMKKILLFLIFNTLLFAGFGKFLLPEEAFKPEVKVLPSQDINVTIHIAKDIHIYAKDTKFSLSDPKIKIVDIQKPKSVMVEGDEVYYGDATFILKLQDTSKEKGVKSLKIRVSFQGCSDRGLCYEPMSKIFNITIDTSKLSSQKVEQKSINPSKQSSANETDMIADTIKNSSLWVIVATFFVFGLLLALTPCVFPMIPIISGLIVSQGENITTKRAFFLSLVYVLAMAVAYTIAGVLAGLFGSNLQAILQNPYVVVAFSAIFVALALSMFGYYELKLPDRFVSKVSSVGQDKGGVVGVAIMGFLSALIVGPCVAAPLAGALVYIGQTGDAFLGGVALFAMSLGMGLPLILVGVGAGSLLAKPGPWMTMVNAIFGIVMLGVAIWMLEKILPPYYTILMWSLLLMATGLYLGAFEKESHIFKRTIAIGLLLYALALFVGVMSGSSSMKEPLKNFALSSNSATTVQSNALQFEVVTSLEELQKVLDANKGKKVLVDFSAKWCTSCKEYEEITFKDPEVQKKMQEFVLVRADVTQTNEKTKELSQKFGVFGPPVILFFDANHNLLKDKTIVGFVEPKEFLEKISSI